MKYISRVEQGISLVLFTHARAILVNTQNEFHISTHPCILFSIYLLVIVPASNFLVFKKQTSPPLIHAVLARTIVIAHVQLNIVVLDSPYFKAFKHVRVNLFTRESSISKIHTWPKVFCATTLTQSSTHI